MPTASNITAPLLIIGPVRSGSTWLSEALLQHGQVQSVIENRLLEAMYHELFHSFWAPNLEMTVPEPERRQRAVAAVRAALCALFPSDAPFWAMKLLSRGRPWAFVFELFPEARFVHMTRSPTTAVPSMTEFVGRDYGVWQELETAESEFVMAHREALRVRDLGKPYLCVRQEDVARDPRRVWEAVCAFGGFAAEPIEGLHREVNAAPSMRGRVRQGRPPLSWAALSPDVLTVSQDLGYLPRAPGRDGVKAVVNAALAAQLEDAERSRAVLARTCDELRAQLIACTARSEASSSRFARCARAATASHWTRSGGC